MLLALGGVELLRNVGETTIPRLDDVRIDGPVLAFTALVALGSGVLFGLLPAFRASRPDAAEALKAGGRGTGSGTIGQGVRSALVVAEVALSLVLLVGAGLLMRSFVRLQSVELGFEPTGLAVVPIRLPEATYPDPEKAAGFFAAVIERVRQLPGVSSVAAVSSAPFAGPNSGLTYTLADRPVDTRERVPDTDYRIVTLGYLRTTGIRLVSGRDFTTHDRLGAPNVILVSETMAKQAWPGESPIGRTLRIGDDRERVHTVIGVVSDARYQSLETPDVRPMLYFSAFARPAAAMAVVVRGASSAEPARGLRDAVASIDSRLPPPTVTMMETLIGEATATRRFALVLFGVFAGTALVLAAVGIYGVLSYLVRQSMQEIGIRIALGAPTRALVGSVVAGHSGWRLSVSRLGCLARRGSRA